MDSTNRLKYLLQSQLATDVSAIRYLPYCLSTLTAECLIPSSHLTKWSTRINALLHSKEAGARWAGLCLAHKTAILSQKNMIDSAQSWITIVLPMLSRSEPTPTLKAAIRLLRVIYTTATEIPEFQRQVSVPNVVKFTNAVMSVADNHVDVELKIMCLETLERVVTLYPTTHRASCNALSAFSLRYLNGSVSGLTDRELLEASSRLYAALPMTGGKVGAVNLWRKSLEETLAFGWEAFYSLRTTFPLPGLNVVRPVPVDEPQVAIPLCQDRLRCSVVTLCNLIGSTIQRPVQVPLGNLVKFIFALVSCSVDGTIDGFVDPLVRSMELSVVPDIWSNGCELLAYLAEHFPYRLDSHAGRLFSVLSSRLEEKPEINQRLSILKAVNSLLQNCHPLDSNVLPTRLAKSALYSVTKILVTSSDGTAGESEPSSSKTKNGKKRARNFEGDEVFKMTPQIVYASNADSDALLVSLDVLQSLFKNPNLSSSMQSIIARVITSVLISLPRIPSSSLSQDPNFIQRVNTKIQQFSFTIGTGTTNVMSKTLPFLIEAALTNSQPQMQRDLGMLLHPRVPPLVRSMPHVESLSLFKAEESHEEQEAMSNLGIEDLHIHPTNEVPEDVVMGESTVPVATSNPISTTTEVTRKPAIEKPPSFVQNGVGPQETPETMSSMGEVSKDDDQIIPTTTTTSFATFGVALNTTKGAPISDPFVLPAEVEDEEEEMPTIDIDSDSDDDEE